MTSFASHTDLTNRGVTVASTDVADALLADASDAIRGIIGCDPYPQRQATFTLWIGRGPQWIRMPSAPVVSIDSASVDGSAVDICRVGEAIKVCGPGELSVTFTFGYDAAPPELVSWTCVIASQTLGVLAELGTLGAGEVSSIGVDDYRKAYKQLADRGAFTLPDNVSQRLAAQYGGGAGVTGVLR